MGDMPEVKPEDRQHFAAILQPTDEDELSPEEHKERKIMKLLLKVRVLGSVSVWWSRCSFVSGA